MIEFLTKLELKNLTGCVHRRLQVDWLQENGWPYVVTGGKRPRVLVERSVALLRLADAGASTSKWTLDVSKVP